LVQVHLGGLGFLGFLGCLAILEVLGNVRKRKRKGF